MKPPRFTDKAKFRYPYADAKASQEPGYLAERFKMIREQMEKDEEERKAKVRQVRKSA